MDFRKLMLRSAACIVAALLAVTVFGSIPAVLAADAENAASEQPAAPVPDPEPLPVTKQPLTFTELAPATTMTFEELVGDNGIHSDEDPSKMPPMPPADKYKLVVDEYHQFATVFEKDSNGKYTVPVRYIVVSTGSRSNPTVKGTFEMGDKYVRFGKFASFGVYGQYWRQITRSFFCHSLIYSSKSARSYTSDSYRNLGTRASHGCVRMLVPDARWVYYNLGAGTVCDIIKGDKDDAKAATIKAQLTRPDRPGERPRLKPEDIPVTEAWPGWQGNAYAQYAAYLTSLDDSEDAEAAEDGDA